MLCFDCDFGYLSFFLNIWAYNVRLKSSYSRFLDIWSLKLKFATRDSEIDFEGGV